MVAQKRVFALFLALFLGNISTLHAAQVLFTPAIIAREEYTDNLYLDDQNEEDDYITVAGLDLAGQVLGRTAGLELSYIPTYNSFANNDHLDYWRHEASLHAWKQFLRNTRLELRDTYLRTNDPTDQTATVEQPGQPPQSVIETDASRRGRNAYYTNATEVRFTHQFGTADSVYAAYRYSLLRDVDPLPGAAVDDNDISTASLGLAYNFTQRLGVALDTSYEDRNYVDRNDRTEFNGSLRLTHSIDRAFSLFLNYRHTVLDYDQDTDESYKIYEPSVGFRYNFPENMYIDLSVGYYYQDFERSDTEDGFNINSDIYKRWTYRSGYLGIRGTSGYQIEDYGARDNGLDLYADGRIDAGYNFTSRLLGTVFCGYRYDKYPNVTPEREQYTTRAGAGMDWQALQWMVVGLSYRFSNINSDIPADEYTENRVVLSIRIAPSSPYRLN